MLDLENRDRATPIQLAEEIVRLVGDADDNTAHTALQIAGLLLAHRKLAELDFHDECINDQSGHL
jgi:hypothetical protein